MEQLKTVILAAGQGTRMKSKMPKVIHKIFDKAMVEYAMEAGKSAGAEEICLVVGHEAEQVMKTVGDKVTYVFQTEQLGTGHAVKCAKDFIGTEGQILILFGDVPLISGETLKKLVKQHRDNKNAVTVLSTVIDDSTGYGRIIRNENGEFIKSVEHKDATEEERKVKEINSGMYVFEANILYQTLDLLKNNNVQGEYYLPDTLMIIKSMNLGKVDAMITEDAKEVQGVNSRIQLAEATRVMQQRINKKWMEAGVTMISPETTFIGSDVIIGKDTIIYPNTILFGNINIAEDSVIEANTVIL